MKMKTNMKMSTEMAMGMGMRGIRGKEELE